MPTVLLIGTLDTKGDEYAYLVERRKLGGVDVLVADTGTGGPPHGLEPDIAAAEVAAEAGAELASLTDRGAAVLHITTGSSGTPAASPTRGIGEVSR